MAKAAALVLLALVVTACGGPSPQPPADAPQTVEQSDTPAVPSDLQAAWWSWSERAPTDQSPVQDRTGEHCAVGQPDDMWFLAGTYGGSAQRECEVPAGRPVALPAVNLVAGSTGECADFMSDAHGKVTVDGAAVPLQAIQGEQIVIETSDGRVQGIGCGLWASIDELSVGPHRLTLSGRSGSFRTRVTYRLRVYRPATS